MLEFPCSSSFKHTKTVQPLPQKISHQKKSPQQLSQVSTSKRNNPNTTFHYHSIFSIGFFIPTPFFPLIFHLQAATWTYPHHQGNPSAPRHGGPEDSESSDRGPAASLRVTPRLGSLGILEPKSMAGRWQLDPLVIRNINGKKTTKRYKTRVRVVEVWSLFLFFCCFAMVWKNMCKRSH